MSSPAPHRLFLGRLPSGEYRYLRDVLRTETVGGVLLLLGAVVALVWANSPWSATYATLRDFSFGPAALDLHLSVEQWAADGLLALFFFVAGTELKRELVLGELREPSKAVLPVIAAVCGMVCPALVFVLSNLTDSGQLSGWAVPTATDIAFALAVLAVLGTNLPSALRAFLLTMAVVDDLLAIIVIAFFYTAGLNLAALGGAIGGLALFWFLHHRGVRAWYLHLPLAFVIWALVHASGVHATVAGVTLGLLVPCVAHHHPAKPRRPATADGTAKVTTHGAPAPPADGDSTGTGPAPQDLPAERIEHRVRPWSAGVAVPLFALLSAGVSVSGPALGRVFTEPAPLGVVGGLFLGKALGIYGGSRLTARFTRAGLNPHLAWSDVFGVAVLAGLGFTVSLLIGDLAFADDPAMAERVKTAVLVGSLLSALVAGLLLKRRDRHYRLLCAAEEHEAQEAQGLRAVAR